jgi:hypothetical protein
MLGPNGERLHRLFERTDVAAGLRLFELRRGEQDFALVGSVVRRGEAGGYEREPAILEPAGFEALGERLDATSELRAMRNLGRRKDPEEAFQRRLGVAGSSA